MGAQVPGVLAIHELHVWRLNQRKTLASAHIVVAKSALNDFMGLAQTVNECLHAYGIHSSTLQPETNESTFGERTIQEGLLLSTKTGHTISMHPLHIENLISLGKIPLRQSLQLAAVPRGEPLSRDFCAV